MAEEVQAPATQRLPQSNGTGSAKTLVNTPHDEESSSVASFAQRAVVDASRAVGLKQYNTRLRASQRAVDESTNACVGRINSASETFHNSVTKDLSGLTTAVGVCKGYLTEFQRQTNDLSNVTKDFNSAWVAHVTKLKDEVRGASNSVSDLEANVRRLSKVVEDLFDFYPLCVFIMTVGMLMLLAHALFVSIGVWPIFAKAMLWCGSVTSGASLVMLLAMTMVRR